VETYFYQTIVTIVRVFGKNSVDRLSDGRVGLGRDQLRLALLETRHVVVQVLDVDFNDTLGERLDTG